MEVTKALSRELNILCHNISLANPLCDIFTSLIEKAVDTRLEFEKADEKITNFLSWQNLEEGMATNLLKTQETHKEILFSKWESQLIKAERVISRARTAMNGVSELVNGSLYMPNLISDCSPGKLPRAKALEYQ